MKMSNNSKQNKQPVLVRQSISTPLPPPEWMEKYNKINPNIINEILEQFKKNGENGRQISLQIVDNEKEQIKIIKMSQWHGFIATIFIFFFAFFSAICGYEKVALAFLGISCIGVIKLLNRKK